MKLIAISGGIGSGKSVVSRILLALGYDVYDCDSRAKQLMDNSEEIKEALRKHFGEDVVVEGIIDRKRLADIVFNNPDKLNRLNSIVHTAVKDDLLKWASLPAKTNCRFVETAILYQSGLDKVVDEVWEVVAPERLRLLRAMRRDNSDEQRTLSRIRSQKIAVENPHGNVHQLVNDDVEAVIPQVLRLLDHQ